MNRDVVVYSRPGCHLCEQALAVIEEVRARVAFALREVDIESDDALFKRYLERIPVVVIDGRESFELFVDSAQFEQALIRSGEAAAHSRVDAS
jgi:glutaredoxin